VHVLAVWTGRVFRGRRPWPTVMTAASASVPSTPPRPSSGRLPAGTGETIRRLPRRYLLPSVNRGEGVAGVISALVTYVYRAPGNPPAVLFGAPPGSESV
jgi:hypothetical protein